MSQTIAILMPGDMGHGCGKVFRENDFRVVTCLNKRSVRTKKLAASSSIEDLGTIENVVDNSDIILSILPPEFALQQAKIVSKVIIKKQKHITYVDCNAISPETALKINDSISSNYCNFIDGGIIGLNPIVENGQTRLYVSGPNTQPVKVLHKKGFIIKDLGTEIGKASAMKMVYASATKGTFALHAAVITASKKLGLFDEYVEELKYSKPNILEAMEKMVPKIPIDAARWEGEMYEISKTFKKENITPKFHQGASAIMKLAKKTPIAKETRENFDKSRSLSKAVDMFVKAIKK